MSGVKLGQGGGHRVKSKLGLGLDQCEIIWVSGVGLGQSLEIRAGW